ncbi:hypothetical protein DPEC_G00342470 [Dallia pectoralis]|uniref:Uncharacterized protein n=1 Tax=Dallia pectoralis TaxID=75939 RepID=A0ACC2F5R2_DALPE|nr:hypothetical protein DPEC_G00342470 [Dallia pectoralis]
MPFANMPRELQGTLQGTASNWAKLSHPSQPFALAFLSGIGRQLCLCFSSNRQSVLLLEDSWLDEPCLDRDTFRLMRGGIWFVQKNRPWNCVSVHVHSGFWDVFYCLYEPMTKWEE